MFFTYTLAFNERYFDAYVFVENSTQSGYRVWCTHTFLTENSFIFFEEYYAYRILVLERGRASILHFREFLFI